MPTTVNPLLANSQASGNPTYPRPITASFVRRFLIFSSSASDVPAAIRGGLSSVAAAAGPLWLGCVFRLRPGSAVLGRLSLPVSLSLRSLTFVALSLLSPLLAVVPDQSFTHAALLDPRHDILESQVDLGIVDHAAQRSFAAVHLAQNRVGMPGGTVDLLEQTLRVGVVVRQPADHAVPLPDALRRL